MRIHSPTQLPDGEFDALIGRRIELIKMLGDAVPAGTKGTVRFVGPILTSRGAPWRQVIVQWENGQNKIVVLPFDRFNVLPILPAATRRVMRQ